MKTELSDLDAIVAVAQAGGFREAARKRATNASRLSDAVRRVESRLGVRLFHRTTRSVVPTEAGRRLLERLAPAMAEVESALDVVNTFRDTPSGRLCLNVPVSASRVVLPRIVPGFLAAYPDIRLEIVADSDLVDIVAAGCDAGIRYDEHLAPDMIAVPIGPRRQRFAAAASPAYLDRHGMPEHPRDLLAHQCLRAKFSNGQLPAWDFARAGESITLDPPATLVVNASGATDLLIDTAVAGGGIVGLFEDWLRPYFAPGPLVPVLEDWWAEFPGPYLYYSSRRLVPAPLQAFIDFVRATGG